MPTLTELTAAQWAGRTTLRVCIGLLVAMSFTVIVVYVATLGTRRMPEQAGRFVITVLLCGWLYRGSRLAKWLLVALLSYAGALGLVLASGGGNPPGVVALVVLALAYWAVALVLIASHDVNAFLAYQRDAPNQAQTATRN